MDCCDVGCHLHRNRRFCSNHSIFFLRWNYRGNHFLRHQFGSAFYCRRIEIADHDPLLVGVGLGDDLDWHYRCRRHLRAGPGVRLIRLSLLPTPSALMRKTGFAKFVACNRVLASRWLLNRFSGNQQSPSIQTPCQAHTIHSCNRMTVSQVTNWERPSSPRDESVQLADMETRYSSKCLNGSPLESSALSWF